MKIEGYHFNNYSHDNNYEKRIEEAKKVMNMYKDMFKSYPNNYNSALYSDAKNNYEKLESAYGKKTKGLKLDLTA